jgi:hypothetical protein
MKYHIVETGTTEDQKRREQLNLLMERDGK